MPSVYCKRRASDTTVRRHGLCVLDTARTACMGGDRGPARRATRGHHLGAGGARIEAGGLGYRIPQLRLRSGKRRVPGGWPENPPLRQTHGGGTGGTGTRRRRPYDASRVPAGPMRKVRGIIPPRATQGEQGVQVNRGYRGEAAATEDGGGPDLAATCKKRATQPASRYTRRPRLRDGPASYPPPGSRSPCPGGGGSHRVPEVDRGNPVLFTSTSKIPLPPKGGHREALPASSALCLHPAAQRLTTLVSYYQALSR